MAHSVDKIIHESHVIMLVLVFRYFESVAAIPAYVDYIVVSGDSNSENPLTKHITLKLRFYIYGMRIGPQHKWKKQVR